MILAKYKPKLDAKAKAQLQQLESYFSDSKNACKRIRNKFSHHHDYGEILKILNEKLKKD